MYISDIISFLNHRLVVPSLPLHKSQFTLDTSGVIGVFGGDEAISAMATVHVCGNMRWLGWYNSPGSYQIAKQLGRVATSGFFNGFFPGVKTDPAALFDLDGRKGPKFIATHSGTIIEEIGCLGALLMEECASLDGKKCDKGRQTGPIGVTVTHLKDAPPSETSFKSLGGYSLIFASIPILTSLYTCAACLAVRDWYAFAMILLGVLANGIAYVVIGGGKFTFTHPEPAEGSPAGDGILISNKGIVLLEGAEGAVNRITRGRFLLHFSSEPNYHDIGWCSVLFAIQFIAQLLLIPQASLFGQVMFVASLGVSWIYNLWLSSLNKKIRRDILLDHVLGKPVLTKYILGTRTAMVTFILLVLKIAEPRGILDQLLPNNTNVWERWKNTIGQRLGSKKELKFASSDWELGVLRKEEKLLLENLYKDAEAADGFYTLHASDFEK